MHVDDELAYVIYGAFTLYFDDLEAEALQGAPGSDLALPSVMGTMWRLCNANVKKKVQFSSSWMGPKS